MEFHFSNFKFEYFNIFRKFSNGGNSKFANFI